MTTARDAWTRPGTYEVAAGVHRIVCPLPRDGLQAVNVYALADGHGVALVDTGWNHPAIVEALTDGLGSLGFGLRDLTRIVCTHSHYDHYGLAAQLRALSGAPVLLGELEVENLGVAIDREVFARAEHQRRAWLREHGAYRLAEWRGDFDAVAARGPWERPDELLADGDAIELDGRSLRALLTPGHTRGHLMFVGDGLVFGGDHLLPHITPSLGFEAFGDGRALARFLASLDAVRNLEGLVLPGHGPVFADIPARVEELEAHHAARLAACVDALRSLGPSSSADVAGRLTWTRREHAFESLNGFNRMLAVTETITHLELLADRGEVERRPGRPLRYAVV
jgi:glyoxylase-like metal-dependent hydrolase (beta-lactamase superfamily II)